ncbi:MAG: hypothetical protein HY513_02680 [Candidatus Aenigmarchaeota archaeon]|nr:hypothetical protein [Candidatus Aenigmarchaeota archaeon]
MTRRLLIVHPRKYYDPLEITKPAIMEFACQFPERDIFVLQDDESTTVQYMGRRFPNMPHSKGGEIRDDDVRRLLSDCTDLTLVGHNFNDCHHTAFEAVVRCTDFVALDITVPTYASTEGCHFRPMSDIIRRSCETYEKSPCDIFYQFGQPYHDISTEEKITLKETQRYVKVANLCCSVDVYVGGKKVFDRQKGNRKINIIFCNRPPIDFR